MAFRVTRASQGTDPGLSDIAGLETNPGDIIVATGVDSYEADATNAAGRSVLDLADPGSDRIAFWDDSGSAFGWLTLGSGLSISGTTLDIGVGSGDLGALESLSGTGIAARIGSDTWAQRTITGTADELTVTNGDGVSGNPTISLPSAITMSGKTLTGGTFSDPTLSGTISGEPTASGVWTFTSSPAIVSSNPFLDFQETDAAADNQKWRVAVNANFFRIRASSDDLSVNTSAFVIARTGTTINEIELNATAIDVNATMDVSGALTNAGVAVPTISSTSTLTNKTLSSPTISGTVAGTPTISSAWAFSASPTVPTPTGSTDAANKAYVDSVAVGLQPKTAVGVATTANITLSGEQTIDGVTTSASRILVKDQSTASQNGIYVTAAGAWSRATDMDAWSETVGAIVPVTAGTANANTIYVSTAAAGGTIGSTSLTFTLFIATSGLQPLDSDLTAIAALTTTSYGRSVLEAANAAALRTLAGTVIGTDVQAYSSVLANTTASFLTADETKLDGIEALADVTDATNVAAAGAFMTSSLAANVATFLGTPSSANLRAAVSDETGTGALVFATSPTLVTPALGTPSALTLTNATGLPISTGVSGLATGVATFLATPSSANLLAAVTNETGTGSLVFATSPTLVTPALGTPSSATLTNATGLPVSTGISGLGTGIATFLGTPSSANLAAAVSDETGSGALVFANGPTLISPALGTPVSGVLTNATGLPISTGVSGLGSGVATFLATPSSANLRTALTDETGTGSAVFATAPTITNPSIDAAGGTLVLPGATSPAQTAEGSVVWDTNDDKLTVGTGSVRKTMVDTDSTQTISGKSVTATGGSVARTFEARFAGEIDALDHCATVDGATDNTTGITAALALGMSTGRPVRFRKGTGSYITEPQNCASSINIILDPGVTVKLKDSATYVESGTTLYVFRLSASNSSVVGGTIDSNKDGQTRATFNAISGGRFMGIWVVGPLGAASRLNNIKIDTTVNNAAGYPVLIQYCDGVDLTIETDNCGGGPFFLSCTRAILNRAILNNMDNDSWKVSPYGVMVTGSDDVTLNNISIPNHASYDVFADGETLDDWFVGVTIQNSDNVTGSNWYVCAKSDATMTKSVGLSIVGLTKFHFSNITVKRYTSVNIELAALEDGDFVNVFADGEYQRADATLWPGEAQQGCHLINQGFYSNLARIKRPVMNVTFTNWQMVRMLAKGTIIYQAVDCTWIGGRWNGNQYGIDIRSDSVNESFPAAETPVTARLKFISPEACWNEVAGMWNGGSTDLEVVSPNFSNNGQAKNAVGNALRLTGTWAFGTSGYFGANSSLTVARVRTRLIAPLLQDDQTVTTAFGSVDPSAPTIVSVERPDLYQFGQTVRINNGGTGPVDLIAQILDIINDELTLDVPITNFPLVAGTGTITTTGTAVTFSSSQAAIITGRMWVKNSTNYRRVIAVASDGLTGTLESAFPTNLTTASFDIVKTEVEQIRSQDYGIYTSNSNDDGIVALECKWGAGNVTLNVSLSGTGIVTSVDSLNYGIGTAAPQYKLHVAGAIGLAPGASVTPINNGDVVLQLTSNTELTLKAKGSDGTVRSNTLTLA